MRRLLTISAVVLGLSLSAVPKASAQQSFSFFLGGFAPQGLDSRGTDDVLYQNSFFLSTFNSPSGIDISDLNGFTFGGEWLAGAGRFVEIGLGLGYYQRTAPAVYTDSTNANGDEIVQDLKLRIVPFSATIRLLPLGNGHGIQPYVGGGVGIFRWHYSESGQFIDPNNNIFVDSFSGDGWETGPIVLGGVRVPAGPMMLGGEIRYQHAKADLPADQGFAGPRIDLSGFNYLFTMNFKF